MRNLCDAEFNQYRVEIPGEWIGDETCGMFSVKQRRGPRLRCKISTGDGWDHISVSTPGRCPNWREMELVKRLFFEPHETAMQLHVPPADHINNHPHVLHIWRPQEQPIPRPPAIMV